MGNDAKPEISEFYFGKHARRREMQFRFKNAHRREMQKHFRDARPALGFGDRGGQHFAVLED